MHLVLLVEEQSMEVLLQTLLSRLLPDDCTHPVNAFQCKDDLKRKLPARLRAYARWLPDDWRIFVLVDRDSDDCEALKNELDDAAQAAGLRTTTSRDAPWQVANRIGDVGGVRAHPAVTWVLSRRTAKVGGRAIDFSAYGSRAESLGELRRVPSNAHGRCP